MDGTGPLVSVIILTRNGMPLVRRCVESALSQVAPWQFQFFVIDSGSNDGTWEFVQSLPISSARIKPADFNHGTTRNLAAQNCRGDFLVFLVQDAIPMDKHWLVNLVEACEPPNVAGSHSKQLVRPESNPITRFLCMGSTPCGDQREIKTLPAGKRAADLSPTEQFKLSLFQNASSCIKRSVWERFPFAPIPYGEDIEWGKRVTHAGYSIVYEPSSAVYHSHDRSAVYVFKRAYADHFLVNRLFGLVMAPSPLASLRTWGWRTREAWQFVMREAMPIRDKLWFALLVPVFTSSIAIGECLGANFCRWLPKYDQLRFLDRWIRNGV